MNIKILASGSSGNCYYISDGKTKLILDAGIEFRRIQAGVDFSISDLRGALITHEHLDHCKAVPKLLRYGVDVYASGGTVAARGWSGHRIHTVRSNDEISIGSFIVKPFRTEHDSAEPLGYLLSSAANGEKLLYFTDTFYLRYTFPACDFILGECNYDDVTLNRSIEEGITSEALAPRIRRSHMSLNTFLQFLKSNDLSKIKQIYILHLSNDRASEETIKRAIQSLTGAEIYIC